jgi:hypothetical protein
MNVDFCKFRGTVCDSHFIKIKNMERKIALYTLEDYDGIEFSATTKTDMVKYLKREGYSPGTTRVFTYMKGHRKGSLKLNAFLKLRWAKESNEVIDEKLIYKKHQDDIDRMRILSSPPKTRF